jgi:DNA modification methylase
MTPSSTPNAPWKNRITGHGEERPDALVANPGNWRVHPKAQQRALAGALGEVGWVAQVIVNRVTGHLVDGHLRVELALSRGEAMVPVTYVELSEDEERTVLASLDPLAAMASADAAKLEELLRDLTPQDDALRTMLDELAREHLGPRTGRTDPEDVPELPAEPYVQPGELWRLGDHRLLCGDATKPEDVARMLDGAEPRLLVTDPPYGVRLDPTWRDGIYNQLGPGAKPYMRIEGHQNTTISGDTVVDWSPAFALVPTLEVAYVWHAGIHAAAVALGLESLGFEIRSQIVWTKTHFAMSRGAYHWQHEPCWYAVRKGHTADWLGDHTLSTVWELASPKMIMGGSDEHKEDHPAQKPYECLARPVRNHRGDVYEPFAGSGTTLIAAEQHGRRCYALELEPRYAQVTIERWQAFTGRTAERLDG